MRIDIVSVVPDLLESPLGHSILKRAQDKGLMEVHIHDLRPYGKGRYKQLDDYQYGGGAGMVMMAGPVSRCLDDLLAARDYEEVIFLTPDGVRLKQSHCNALSLASNLLLLCGHYKGLDERIREKYITREFSIGDYVLSGGELPAAVLVDAIGRLIPGVIGDGTSALEDSFQNDMLAPPVYTRPAEFKGMKVPDVLLSGNSAAIEAWRRDAALERTKSRRPDLLEEQDDMS